MIYLKEYNHDDIYTEISFGEYEDRVGIDNFNSRIVSFSEKEKREIKKLFTNSLESFHYLNQFWKSINDRFPIQMLTSLSPKAIEFLITTDQSIGNISIFLSKDNDEWFYVFVNWYKSGMEKFYKCDRMDGLSFFYKDFLKRFR